jgi:type I restriction enzyme M protein
VKADAIDAAVYDLKAVNPREPTHIDKRTPDEILDSIEAQGQIISEALVQLRKLMSTTVQPSLVTGER